ncbi:RlpA-like double-psi beta-barrel domain-containing protein [Rhodotorula paludigena]|uniref:RlpA-like double-psi beta-barrel domain-containing protein n=1 Tax=Rhodotorula paludigena TaxID=86838 RepID=UPI003180C098
MVRLVPLPTLASWPNNQQLTLRSSASQGKKDYGDADGSGEHTASDSDGGNGGHPSDNERHEDDDDDRGHHSRRKRGGAGGGTGAGQAAPGDRQLESGKTPWIIGGVVAVIVVVVLCVGLILLTWFEADNKVSECGSKAGDEDYVIRVGPDLYGSSSGISTLCGTFLTLYHLEKDAYVRASVEGLCDECTGHNLIVSQAVFHSLTDNLDIGMTLSQYWLTDAEHEPKRTIKSPGAGDEEGATRTTGEAGATETGGAGGNGRTRPAADEADLDA